MEAPETDKDNRPDAGSGNTEAAVHGGINKSRLMLTRQTVAFSRAVIDEMFANRIDPKAAVASCAVTIAKLLCWLVDSGEMTEAEAARKIASLPGFVTMLCKHDRRPIFKENQQ